MRICSLYGAGFFFIPGTDTCIKIGGYMRADTTFNGGVHGQPAWSSDLGQQNRFRDYFVSRSRMALTIVPALRPNTAWCAPSARVTSSSRTSETATPEPPLSLTRL